MLGKTLLHELTISYSHTELYLFFRLQVSTTVHKENPVRYGRNTNATTKLRIFVSAVLHFIYSLLSSLLSSSSFVCVLILFHYRLSHAHVFGKTLHKFTNFYNHTQWNHRVDSVMESSLREILGRKNFAHINLSLNFCEMTIYDNKVFLENLVAVH